MAKPRTLKFSRQTLNYILLICVFVGAFLVVKEAKMFTIQKIECKVGSEMCPTDLTNEWQKYIGKSIFFTDFTQLNQQLLQRHPNFTLLSLHKNLPNQISLQYQTIEIAYGIQTDNQPILLVNQTGLVTNSTTQTDLPVVQFPDAQYTAVPPGTTLDPVLHLQILQMLDMIKTQDIPSKTLRLVDNDQMELELTDNKKVELRRDDIASELIKLEYVLKTVNFSSFKEPIKEIDLRFQHPVLRT